MKNKNKKSILDINTIEQITMLLQISLCIYAISFAIASAFEKSFFVICELLISILMFVIAYNNHKIYKRKYMTAIYTGLGIVMIASVLFL